MSRDGNTGPAPASPAPTVSVIIPMRDAAATVGRTLASLAAQTLADWRAIVVDDGSIDESGRIVEAAAGDARITLARTGEARGVSAARNAGLDLATGEYVHFLDADDTLAPGALAVLVGAERRACSGGAAGGFELRNARGERLVTQRPRTAAGASFGLDELIDRETMLTMSHLVRRDAIGGLRFDTSLAGYEDLDLWLRLAQRGVRWACMSETVATYHIRPGSLSKASATMLACAGRVMDECFARCRGEERFAAIDLSAARLARRRYHLGLDYATRAALLGGEPAGRGAAELFADHARPGPDVRVTPADAAAKAYWQSVYGLGEAPTTGDRAAPWARGLAALWRTLEERALAAPGLTDSAWAALADRLASARAA